MSGNARCDFVHFDLGGGATYRGAAGAWASANYVGATGAVSVVAINGATFYITGVKLEIGSVATPFNRQSLAKSMADCQRYYQIVRAIADLASIRGSGMQTYYNICRFTMRATPTTVITSSSGTNESVTQRLSVTHLVHLSIRDYGHGELRRRLSIDYCSAEL